MDSVYSVIDPSEISPHPSLH